MSNLKCFKVRKKGLEVDLHFTEAQLNVVSLTLVRFHPQSLKASTAATLAAKDLTGNKDRHQRLQ